MTGRYLTFGAAECVCDCGKRQTFSERPWGPDTLARNAGWTIRWPGPEVRCPSCARQALAPFSSTEEKGNLHDGIECVCGKYRGCTFPNCAHKRPTPAEEP